MRRLIYLIFAVNFLLIFLPGASPCEAAASQYELEWDHLSSHVKQRNLDTSSLHILKKFSSSQSKSVYRGVTITRSRGDIFWQNENRYSSAYGVGPVYLLRFSKQYSARFSAAIDVSGGFIIYNKRYPAGAEYYNFMWRIGPRLIYNFNKNTALNIGYTLMHVSNGLSKNNPGDDAHGLSLGFTAKF